MQLQKELVTAKKAGLNVVGVSGDKETILRQFSSKYGVEFPLLSDADCELIKQFGLLDTKAGNIALPMTVLVDSKGFVRAKLPGTVQERHSVAHVAKTWQAIENAEAKAKKTVAKALSFGMKNLSGQNVDLRNYLGKVVVVVNVASKCGYTPQYQPLQELYKKHKNEGLAILGFPCNQFGKQEPGTASEILDFCEVNYGVEFDMFSKIDVTGDNQSPFFKYLSSQSSKDFTSGPVKWNFEKFVIDRTGKVVARFPSNVSPTSPGFLSTIEKLLDEKVQ